MKNLKLMEAISKFLMDLDCVSRVLIIFGLFGLLYLISINQIAGVELATFLANLFSIMKRSNSK